MATTSSSDQDTNDEVKDKVFSNLSRSELIYTSQNQHKHI